MAILVVDDSETSRIIIERSLRTAGFNEVESAVDGEDALAHLADTRPERRPVELILMDINMPRMDGIEATRRIVAHPEWRDIPVIVVTAGAEEETLEPAFRAGAVDFISKPISPVVLRARVTAALRLSEETAKRKEREQDLAFNEARLRTILGSIQAGVIILDAESLQLVDVNPMACRLIGMSREELLGRECHHFICMSDNEDCPVAKGSGVVFNEERELFTVDRGSIPVLKTAAPVTLGSRRCILESFVDITTQKEAECNLRDALTELELLFDNSLVGILYTKDRVVVRINDRGAEIFGRTKEELEGRSTELVHHSKKAFLDFGREFLETLQRTGAYSGEKAFRRKDGSLVYVVMHAKAIDPDDIHQGVIWTLDDITERKRMVSALRRNEEQYRLLVENSQTLVMRLQPDGEVSFLNDFAARFFGWRVQEAVGCGLASVLRIDEDEADRYLQRLAEGILSSENEYYQTESEYTLRTGRRAWVLWSNKAVRDTEGVLAEVLCVGLDITARKQAERELAESHFFFQNVIDSLPPPIYFQDPEGRLQLVNTAFEYLTGKSKDAVLGRPFGDIFPADEEQLWRAMEMDMLHSDSPRVQWEETTVRYPDGADRAVIINQALIHDSRGGLSGVVGAVMDITERKRMEDELREMATTDGLTGVWNRRHFMERARAEVERAKRYGTPLSLLMIDVDNFKSVNDRFGHDVGDAALVALAETGREMLRPSDGFARLGGEEFAVILPHTPLAAATAMAERFRRAVELLEIASAAGEPGGEPVRMTISIGVAHIREPEYNLDILMKQADRGLYKAKQNGRNCIYDNANGTT